MKGQDAELGIDQPLQEIPVHRKLMLKKVRIGWSIAVAEGSVISYPVYGVFGMIPS